ncbi:MAG: stage II sporulation protein D [bacterium]|nr:stage II sporulation protein D [bacterium]
MKTMYATLFVILFFSIIFIPLLNILPNKSSKTAPSTDISENQDDRQQDVFLMKKSDTGEVVEITADEYVIGVVACEMPITYNDEALKAQAVAAYTYAVRKRIGRVKNRSEYDITDDSTKDQGYINPQKRKEKWGGDSEKNEAKLQAIISSVKGKTVTNNDEPILAAYHAISSGKTESAKNVWGGDYPYLVGVESAGDLLCPDYLSEVSFEKGQVEAVAKTLGAKLGDDVSKYISNIKTSNTGTVLSCQFGDKTVTGSEIRTGFSLRSANFSVSVKSDRLVFVVKGYGHGVGMSQYGANYMAMQGSGFEEILQWYYKDCKVSDGKLKNPGN